MKIIILVIALDTVKSPSVISRTFLNESYTNPSIVWFSISYVLYVFPSSMDKYDVHSPTDKISFASIIKLDSVSEVDKPLKYF